VTRDPVTFSPGQMDFCEGCENERYCDEGDMLYCALGAKIDSEQCVRWERYWLARRIANAFGQALDVLPAGAYRLRADGGEMPDDDLYEKERLVGRAQDALADYFDEVWTADTNTLVAWPAGGTR